MATPRKGKAKVKVTSTGKRVSYGQSGKAKDGGPRVRAGTKGDAYCARSLAQKRSTPKPQRTLTHHSTYPESDGSAAVPNREGSDHA